MKLSGAYLEPGRPRLLLIARIVSRIDEVDAARPHILNLDYRRLVPRPDIMGVIGWQDEDGPWLKHLTLGVELSPRAVTDHTADHGDNLGIGMRMRRDAIVWRKLIANDDGLGLTPLKNGWSFHTSSSALITFMASCAPAEHVAAINASEMRIRFMEFSCGVGENAHL
jgi:hypothetical protein